VCDSEGRAGRILNAAYECAQWNPVMSGGGGGSSLSPGVERRERTEKSRGRNSVVASQAAFTSARFFVSVYRCVCD